MLAAAAGIGLPGEDGEQGPPGPPGVAGAAGAAGMAGIAGPPGYYGDDGEEGPSGPPGLSGMAGVAGGAGPAGPAGPMGLLIGEDGDEGAPGAPGQPGVAGAAGATGPAGPMGLIYGEDGDEGPMGPPGGGGGSALTVEESDGSPTNAAITKIVVPNDSLSIAGSVATLRQVPYGFIGCRGSETAAQAIANNTWTAITMTAADSYDTDNFHSTSSNTSRFTVPAGLGGKYSITAFLGWASSAAGSRFTALAKNGTRILDMPLSGAAVANTFAITGVGMPVTDILDLVAGDYIELHGYQDSGGSLNTSGAYLAATKLDAGRVGSGVGASVYKSADLTLTTGSEQNLTFNSELFDTDGFHDTSTNAQRFTIPTGMGGKYYIDFTLHASVNPGTGAYAIVRKNGSSIVAMGMFVWDGSAHGTAVGSAIVDLAATDYVEIKYLAASAGKITGTSTWAPMFSIMRLDTVGRDVAKTIRGQVSAAGSIVRGTGFTAVKNSTGNYTVTFTTAFGSSPIVVASGFGFPADIREVYVNVVSTTACDILTGQPGAGSRDQEFTFIAMSVD